MMAALSSCLLTSKSVRSVDGSFVGFIVQWLFVHCCKEQFMLLKYREVRVGCLNKYQLSPILNRVNALRTY